MTPEELQPRDPRDTAAAFSAQEFWGVGLMPLGISAVGGLAGSIVACIAAMLMALPCAILAGIIFSRHCREKGKPPIVYPLLVSASLLVTTVAASLFGILFAILENWEH